MTVKIRMGEIIRSLNLIANHNPNTSIGKNAHQTTISEGWIEGYCYARQSRDPHVLEDLVRAQVNDYRRRCPENRIHQLHRQHIAADHSIDRTHQVDHAPAGRCAASKLMSDGPRRYNKVSRAFMLPPNCYKSSGKSSRVFRSIRN